jgi:putative transposase
MPRKSRIDTPGALHHVIIRGIERSPIFRDTQDYESFISRHARLVNETATSCYAWALMGNHVHLLLRSGHASLSTFMRRLLTGYAQQFNRRYNRSGHLFQNRYKSFLCEEDPYLLELVRYIHLNPIRAGAAQDMAALADYPWCGHSALMGRTTRDWQGVAFVLSLFGDKRTSARRAYASFVEKGIALGKRPDLTGGGLIRSAGGWVAVQDLRKSKEHFASDERILGGSEFVSSLLKKANEHYERKTASHGIDLEKLILVACTYLDISPALLKSPSKPSVVTRARAIVSAIAFDTLRVKGTDIARAFNLTPAAVCRLTAKGRADSLKEDVENFFLENKDLQG